MVLYVFNGSKPEKRLILADGFSAQNCTLRRSGCVAVVYTLLAGFAGSALGANYSASDDATLRQAIINANSDGDPTSTVALTSNIVLSSSTALTTVTKPITIDTGGFTLSGTDGLGTAAGVGPTFANGSITLVGTLAGGLSGDGGSTGVGGAGVVVSSSSLLNTGNLIGGNGRDTANGAPTGATGRVSGSGGTGAVVTNSQFVNQAGATITGGDSGTYDVQGSTYSTALNLPAGASGLSMTNSTANSGSLNNEGVIRGGAGGDAINPSSSTRARGGAGGFGVTLTSGSHINSGLIVGGSGGVGFFNGVSANAFNGMGGTGLQLVSATMMNTGTIAGADGTRAVDPNLANNPRGSSGTGVIMDSSILHNTGTIMGGDMDIQPTGVLPAVGVTGSNSTLINSGLISSGKVLALSNPILYAVRLTTGTNVLELRAGYQFDGLVAGAPLATLALGGTTNADFDTTLVGSTAQYRSFGQYRKIGTSTWTLSGATTAVTPWSLLGGVLSVSSDESLGDQSGALSFDGGTLRVTGSTSTSRNINIRAGGGGFDIESATSIFTLGQSIVGTGQLTKLGSGTLVMTGDNTYTGGTTITAGMLQIGQGGTTGSLLGDVSNDSALTFNRSDTLDFAGSIRGAGTISQVGTGRTTLTGNSSGFSGVTNVTAGTLSVNGALGNATSMIDVSNAATLGGTGTIGGSVSVDDATLAPGNSPGTLTIVGDLALGSASQLNYELGAANIPGGALNDLISVGGNLILDGTLNVTESSGGTYDAGIYRLINYTGALTNNGLALGNMPIGSQNYIQTSVAQQVNLINSNGLTLNYWDGDAGARNDGNIASGNGTWQLGGPDNWTQADGLINAQYQNPSFAVFTGTPGTITIDNTEGAVSASGMQFANDGYLIQGDDLELVGGNDVIRVGDGTAAGVDMIATIASGLTGAGQLNKTDSGKLVLTGENTYTGGTLISDGTLQLGDGGTTGSLLGDVTNNSTLTFNRSDALDFAGSISGAGTISQVGTGDTTLTGDSSGFSGIANVTAGTLSVNGALGNATSMTTVSNGATLGGSGTVGATTVQGAVTPGNALIGTLNVNGDYTQASTSTYQVQVDTVNKTADRIAISGIATLSAGSTLNVTRAAGSPYTLGSQYTVLSATGGLSGTYNLTGDEITAFVGMIDTYDANNVYLTATQTKAFQDAALTSNQSATAAALQGLSSQNELRDAVLFINSNAVARNAFDQLSGEIHASVKTALLDDSRFVREAANERLLDAYCAPGVGDQIRKQSLQADAQSERECSSDAEFTQWGRIYSSSGDTEASGSAADQDRSINGYVVGIDNVLANGWRIGGMAGYSRSDYDVDARNSSANGDSYTLGAYGGNQWGANSLRLGTTYSWQKLNTQRYVNIDGYSDSLKAKYDTATAQVFAEVGHGFVTNNSLAVELFAGLAYVNVKGEDFKERGGLAALSGGSSTSDATFSTLGVRISAPISDNTKLTATTGWRHVLDSSMPGVTNSFGGEEYFSVSGAPLPKNVGILNLGIETKLKSNLKISASFAGQFKNSGDDTDSGVNASLGWSF